MAFDFPDAPSEGQYFSPAAGAPTYVYRAPAWELVTVAGITEAPTDGQSYGRKGQDASWQAITKTMVGLSNVDNTADASKPVSTAQAAADALKVAKAGDTMSGDLAISKATPGFSLNKTAATQPNSVVGTLSGTPRWAIKIGNETPESGGNAGSDFVINRYNDAGVYAGTSMTITRSNGYVGMAVVNPTVILVDHASAGGTINNVPGLYYDSGNGLIIESATLPQSLNRNGGNGAIVTFYQTGTLCGSIAVANAVSTAYNTSSDKRLKENLEPFDAGPILDATEVYHFKWIGSAATGYGVMAQDAIEVFPDAVTHDEEHDKWGVDYSKYVPLLLQEIKALRARVAALEAGGA